MWKKILSPVDFVFALGYGALERIKKSTERETRKEEHQRDAARPSNTLGTLAIYTILVLLAAAPAFYLGWGQVKGFNSPDESAAYLAAQLFVEDGRLYLEDSLTALSPSVPTGPRGFTQHNGRSVPIYPLGHPLAVGVAHKFFGGAAPLVLAVVPALLILSLAILVRVLAPTAPAYLGFLFLGIVPLWYWASRIYMNLALSLLLIAIGVLCLTLAVKRQSLYWLLAGSSAFALGALARHPEAAFLLIVGVAFLVALIRKQPSFRWGRALLTAFVYAVPQLLLFLLPMALLNWWTYGSPLSMGYLANYDRNLPDRLPSDSNLLLMAINYARLAFFPVPVDLTVLFRGSLYQILLMAPLVVALGIAGIFLARRKLMEVFGYSGLGLLALALLYVLVSRADPGTFRALATEPDVRASIIRYWMPVYIVLGLGTAYALAHFPRVASLVVVCAMVFLGTIQVWITSPEAILGLKRLMHQQSAKYAIVLDEFTESDALVFVGDRRDKWVAPVRRTAVTWSDTPTRDGIRHVTKAAEAVYLNGQPVYFLLGARHRESLDLVNQEFVATPLTVERLPTAAYGDIELWKVVPRRSPINVEEMEPGVYSTQISTPGSPFSIEIDSLVRSHVVNGSFENGLHGWSGPGVGTEVLLTSETFLVGQSSMRMELFPSSGPSALVRQTYTLDAKNLNANEWYAVSHVMARTLVDAEASMRIFISDEDGNRIKRYEAVLSESTDAYQSLIIEDGPLMSEASSIAFQLAIRPLKEGGRGVVFWDGVDLISGKSLQEEGCIENMDGDCIWLTGLSLANGKINSGIESIRLRSLNGSEGLLTGPFYKDDRLNFKENAVYLERDGKEQKTLALFSTPRENDPVGLIVTSGSPPILKLVAGS